ncbi:hypothetical protein BK704_34745 [[Bacillus thuringiensis] serovar konkukian]|nr:hypothetical protein BK704_34745 [[Bacillus thuringiensis] serovar konkukian]
MYSKYGWKIEKSDYSKGTVLFGCNFNTNDEWGKDERETYVCIYLFKFVITIGKFHYRVN